MARSYSYSEKIERNKFIFTIIFIFAVTVLFYNVISHFIFKTYRIQTKIMEPSFKSGQILVSTPIFKRENLRRGDLVFRKAFHKSNLNIFQKLVNKVFSLFSAKMIKPFGEERNSSTSAAVFRIIGLPGDTIYIDNFVAHIKNKDVPNFLTEFELSEVDYNILTPQLPEGWQSEMPFSGTSEEFVLGKDEFFLLSDKRLASLDSRLSGTCHEKNIGEKIIFISWPIRDWKSF